MSEFWKRVIDLKPELIDSFCYFSPTKTANLKLIIRGDGTISPAQDSSRHYESVESLAESWMNGDLLSEKGLKLSTKTKPSKLSFDNDCFLSPGRRDKLRNAVNSTVVSVENALTSTVVAVENALDSTVDSVENALDSTVDSVENALDSTVVSVDVAATEHSVATSTNDFANGNPLDVNLVDTRPTRKCPGLPSEKFLPVMECRNWNGAREQFSPVVIEGETCRAKSCILNIPAYMKICFDCKLAKKRLLEARRYLKKSPMNDDRRIKATPNLFLTRNEQLHKRELINKQKDNALRLLRRKAKQTERLEKCLDEYRPVNKINRIAIRSIVKRLDAEESKVRYPECGWLVDGQICGFKTSSIKRLCRHIRESHFEPQLEFNSECQPIDRLYQCNWNGCRRREAYPTFLDLRRHVIMHSGNAKTDERLDILREQLVNYSREPTGRRYGNATKRTVMRQYKSRRTWNRTLEACTLPMPSVRSVLSWKNDGEIKSGIDWTVLQIMGEIGETSPRLRHGIVTMDEIYVDEKLQLVPNGEREFGKADNYPAELARTVLVFQYVGLFSKKRYAANVAWYGCTRLDSSVLEMWLWDVLTALYRYGYFVHAIVCDGAAINRCLQKQLVSDAARVSPRKYEDYEIPHPLATDPDIRLFLFSDPSHVLKRLRNCWYNREMQFVGTANKRYPIRWSDLLDVHEWQKQQPRVDRRLTDKHIDMNNYNKMNVRTAIDVFSEPIENAMAEIHPINSIGTRDYMAMSRELWLGMNDRRMYLDESSAQRSFSSFTKIAADLKHWRKNTILEPRVFLTTETYTDALRLCEATPAFMRYIWTVVSKQVPNVGCIPNVISQDPLEQTFGALRQRGGGTQHITVLSIAYNLRAINCNILSEFRREPVD